MDAGVMTYGVKDHTRSTIDVTMATFSVHQETVVHHVVVPVNMAVDNITIESIQQERSFAAMISLTLVLGFLVILTITGNLLVIAAVVINPHLRTTTYFFIANLAMADLLLGTIVLPFSATLEVLQYWVFGQIFCHVWAAFDVLCCTASILSLCVISIDRYIGVTRPLQHSQIMHQTRTMYVIVLVWLLSIAISVAPLIGWKEDPNPDPRVCTVTTQPGYVLFSASGSFYIPCFIILIVYFRIYRETVKYTRCLMSGAKTAKVDEDNVISLRIHLGRHVSTDSHHENYEMNANDGLVDDYSNATSQHPHNKSNKRNSRVTFSNKVAKFRREKKAAKTLGIVVGVFITCWLPFFVILPLGSFCSSCSIPQVLFKLFFWLGYCNSVMNPIIYTCSSIECRRAFLAILSCRRCRKRHRASLSELQGKPRTPRAQNCVGRNVLRHKQHPLKETEVQYPLCEISSSSSSHPEILGEIQQGIKPPLTSSPKPVVNNRDYIPDNRSLVLKDNGREEVRSNICSNCKTNTNLKTWLYDEHISLHQKIQTCTFISREKVDGVTS